MMMSDDDRLVMSADRRLADLLTTFEVVKKTFRSLEANARNAGNYEDALRYQTIACTINDIAMSQTRVAMQQPFTTTVITKKTVIE